MRDPGRLRLSAATPSGWLLFCARSCESRRHSAPGLCVPPKDRRNALAGLGIVIAGSIVRRSRNDLMWYYAVRRIMLAIPIALGVTIIVAGATAWKTAQCHPSVSIVKDGGYCGEAFGEDPALEPDLAFLVEHKLSLGRLAGRQSEGSPSKPTQDSGPARALKSALCPANEQPLDQNISRRSDADRMF